MRKKQFDFETSSMLEIFFNSKVYNVKKMSCVLKQRTSGT